MMHECRTGPFSSAFTIEVEVAVAVDVAIVVRIRIEFEGAVRGVNDARVQNRALLICRLKLKLQLGLRFRKTTFLVGASGA
jgi:hypothetical protein